MTAAAVLEVTHLHKKSAIITPLTQSNAYIQLGELILGHETMHLH